MCLPVSNICDGTRDCPFGEDEEDCPCPNSCSMCNNGTFICHPSDFLEIPLSARSIDISNGKFDTQRLCQTKRHALETLIMTFTQITNIDCLVQIESFSSLRLLDLSNNNINYIGQLRLPALQKVILDYNPILKLHLVGSIRLFLRHTNIPRIQWRTADKEDYAPMSLTPNHIPEKRDPMGTPVLCNLTELDLQYNRIDI